MGWNSNKTRELRQSIIGRFDYKCWYCGCEITTGLRHNGTDPDVKSAATVDHLIPRIRGGNDDESNLVPSCFSCNASKRNKTLEEYRATILAESSPHYRALLSLDNCVAEIVLVEDGPFPFNEQCGLLSDWLVSKITPVRFYGETIIEKDH